MTFFHGHSNRSIQIVLARTIVALAQALLVLVCPRVAQADLTLPFVIQDSLYRTNVAISNLDALPAEVSIVLYDNSGHLAAQGAVQIPSLGMVNLSGVVSYVFGYPYDPPFEGFVRLRSAARIAAFASQIRKANGDPGIIAAVPDDASHFLLPITTSIESWSSALAIVNLASQATVVKIALRDETGRLLAETERNLESSSQWISTNIHRELGVRGVRGPLTVRSMDAAPLALSCRHTQTLTRQDVFQQAFDLRNAAKVFYLPYRFEEHLHNSWVVLNNLDSAPATVTLQPFSPDGIALNEYSFQIPALGSTIVADTLFLGGQGDQPPYGIIRGSSNQALSGLIIQTNLATQDTIHTNLVTADSPEILVPSVTETSTFSSNLLLSNLGDTDTWIEWIELTNRTANSPKPVPVFKTPLPARGSVYLDRVLIGMGVRSGYGPLAVRSIEGHPLAAFSHVMNIENGGRDVLNSVDSRLATLKQRGQRLTLRWHSEPSDVLKIQEYRIYRADRIERNFQQIASVPVSQLEYIMDAIEPGDFVLAVKAFDGVTESNPSNEVLLRVTP